MKIDINDHRKLFAIQEEFASQFPFLKLGFFSKPVHVHGFASHKIIKHPNKSIGECRTNQHSGSLIIMPQMTVSDLENQFRDKFGLSVQVFRCSGNAWLETSLTDDWTLEEQNNHGRELSKKVS
jgi:hypothetical protein